MINAKELDNETSYTHFGARYYDSELIGWPSVDAMSDKYPSLSPYCYTADNLVVLLYPNGEIVIALNLDAQRAILNTLTKEDMAYVKFDEHGMIDKNLLNKANSTSYNFNAFKQLVNHETTFEINVSDKFLYKDENGNIKEYKFDPIIQTDDKNGPFGLNTGDTGFLGVTQTPGNESEKYNSPDNSVKITINKGLSKEVRAQALSHEAYGHAYLYSKGEDYIHRAIYTSEGFKETNIKLSEQITRAISETIQNMKNNEY
ncbi:MAG TPA: hypothetical protein PLM87_05490 [Bacteroidales bacterium]|nr:hypothetical protein [Bacteroidales bacterium]